MSCPKCSSKVIFSETLFNGGIVSLFCVCGFRTYNFLTSGDIGEVPYKIIKCRRCGDDVRVTVDNNSTKKYCNNCSLNLNRNRARVGKRRRKLEAQIV